MDKNNTVLCQDFVSGEFFRTTEDALRKTQEKINKEFSRSGFISAYDYYEVMSRNWPDDIREKFFADLSKHEGWKKCGFSLDPEKEQFVLKKFLVHTKADGEFVQVIFSTEKKG